MRLLVPRGFFATTLLACLLIISPCHGYPPSRTGADSLSLRRGVGGSVDQDKLPPHLRTITLVTDVYLPSLLDPGPHAEPEPELIPAHSFLIFGQTAYEPAMKIELVAPLNVKSQPNGLAISITEFHFHFTAAEEDLSWRQPTDTERRYHEFSPGTSFTNLELASIRTASDRNPNPLAGRSLIEDIWLRNAGALAQPGSPNKTPGTFRTSHEFVARILERIPDLPIPGLSGETLPTIFNDLMGEGQRWATAERERTRPPNVRDIYPWVTHLIVDTVRPVQPTEYRPPWVAAPPERELQRALFVIDKTAKVWIPLQIPPETDLRLPQMVLSRDPRLTSDVMPLDARGRGLPVKGMGDLGWNWPREGSPTPPA